MITIYAPEAQDFSTLGAWGAGALRVRPLEEQAGGMYELTMTHPMDAEGKVAEHRRGLHRQGPRAGAGNAAGWRSEDRGRGHESR